MTSGAEHAQTCLARPGDSGTRLASPSQSRFFLVVHDCFLKPSWLPSSARIHPHTAHPCPCKAPAAGKPEFLRPPGQPAARSEERRVGKESRCPWTTKDYGRNG